MPLNGQEEKLINFKKNNGFFLRGGSKANEWSLMEKSGAWWKHSG
jgi:hypothetical protein